MGLTKVINTDQYWWICGQKKTNSYAI